MSSKKQGRRLLRNNKLPRIRLLPLLLLVLVLSNTLMALVAPPPRCSSRWMSTHLQRLVTQQSMPSLRWSHKCNSLCSSSKKTTGRIWKPFTAALSARVTQAVGPTAPVLPTVEPPSAQAVAPEQSPTKEELEKQKKDLEVTAASLFAAGVERADEFGPAQVTKPILSPYGNLDNFHDTKLG